MLRCGLDFVVRDFSAPGAHPGIPNRFLTIQNICQSGLSGGSAATCGHPWIECGRAPQWLGSGEVSSCRWQRRRSWCLFSGTTGASVRTVYATALCPAVSGKPLWVVLQTGVQGNQGLCAGKSRTMDRALRLSSRGTRLRKVAGSHSRNCSPSGRKSAAVERQTS